MFNKKVIILKSNIKHFIIFRSIVLISNIFLEEGSPKALLVHRNFNFIPGFSAANSLIVINFTVSYFSNNGF